VVKLVGQPADLSQAPRGEAPPPAPKEEKKPARTKTGQKAKKAAPKPSKGSPKKGAMPELDQRKPKPEQPEQAKQAPAEQGAAPADAAKQEGKAEGVAVSPTSEEFKFPFYLATIRQNIERNWNPPPGVKGINAKVQFTILRSGWVVKSDLKLMASSGNYYFDQAAMRAILQSSPFPQMPEDYPKQSLELSVDLTEQE
jgi:TonB family protein